MWFNTRYGEFWTIQKTLEVIFAYAAFCNLSHAFCHTIWDGVGCAGWVDEVTFLGHFSPPYVFLPADHQVEIFWVGLRRRLISWSVIGGISRAHGEKYHEKHVARKYSTRSWSNWSRERVTTRFTYIARQPLSPHPNSTWTDWVNLLTSNIYPFFERTSWRRVNVLLDKTSWERPSLTHSCFSLSDDSVFIEMIIKYIIISQIFHTF